MSLPMKWYSSALESFFHQASKSRFFSAASFLKLVKYQTNNARSEELAEKNSYKDPWKRGQRCIIPAASFDEPNWETGKNIWWQFSRADGAPWGLAGLWNVWTNKDTGEVHESYTMLTLNADDLAQALGDAALHLAFDNHRVDDVAEVVHRRAGTMATPG